MGRALALGLVAALCLPGAAAARLPRDFFGVMANGPLDAPGFPLDAESVQMKRLGVESERMEIAWDEVEPQPGQYDWQLTDRKVLAAARAGLDVLALVVRCPSWAAVDPSAPPFSPPRSAGDYARFTRTLVRRYGPGGILWRRHPALRRPVRAWQIWNEPNLRVYWPQQPFMRRYAELLDYAYDAVERVDRRATVVMAGMANFSWKDLRRLFERGGRKLRFDVAAVHPFSGYPSDSVRIVKSNRRVLDRHGAKGKPIWLTELTWSSAKGRKLPLTKDWETTEVGQAERLRQAYSLYVRERRRLRLQRIYWYTWLTVDRDSPNSFDYSGLRTQLPDGRVADKPAAHAFRSIARRYR